MVMVDVAQVGEGATPHAVPILGKREPSPGGHSGDVEQPVIPPSPADRGATSKRPGDGNHDLPSFTDEALNPVNNDPTLDGRRGHPRAYSAHWIGKRPKPRLERMRQPTGHSRKPSGSNVDERDVPRHPDLVVQRAGPGSSEPTSSLKVTRHARGIGKVIGGPGRNHRQRHPSQVGSTGGRSQRPIPTSNNHPIRTRRKVSRQVSDIKQRNPNPTPTQQPKDPIASSSPTTGPRIGDNSKVHTPDSASPTQTLGT